MVNTVKWKLRETKKDDYLFIYELIADFFKTDLNVTYLKLESYDEFIKRNFSEGTINYTILNENDEKIGYVHMIKNNEIGYFLSPEYQGKGIGPQAVKKMMDLHPRQTYFATIHNKNYPSINLVTKLGFKPKGTIFEKKE